MATDGDGDEAGVAAGASDDSCATVGIAPNAKHNDTTPAAAHGLRMSSPFSGAGRVRQWLGTVPAAMMWAMSHRLPLSPILDPLSSRGRVGAAPRSGSLDDQPHRARGVSLASVEGQHHQRLGKPVDRGEMQGVERPDVVSTAELSGSR